MGLEHEEAVGVAERCARDPMPPPRRRVLIDVGNNPGSFLADVVKRIQIPKTTVDRTLQELHLLGLLTVEDVPWGQQGSVRWAYTLAKNVQVETLRRLTRNVTRAGSRFSPAAGQPDPSLPKETGPGGSDISGRLSEDTQATLDAGVTPA